MEKITVKEIINETESKLIFGDPNEIINDISTDTRSLKRGDYFVALKGERYDGHDFLKNAIERGCSGVVISHFTEFFNIHLTNIPTIIMTKDTGEFICQLAKYYLNKKVSPIVIGISGSNGKTTTKDILYSILSRYAPTVANPKSYNNTVGLPLTIFKTMSYHKFCILEHGISKPNEMEKLLDISRPKIGLVTNIGHTHLEFLKTKESVFHEETKLLLSLPDDGIAIINKDDEFISKLELELKIRKITFGLNEFANVTATDIKYYSNKTKFQLIIKNELNDTVVSSLVVLPTVGLFNVYNALSASAVAYALDVDISVIKEGIENFTPSPMRMEQITLPTGTIIVNDAYNANFDSIKESLTTFCEIYSNNKKICVLGDMLELGDSTKELHEKLGDFISKLSVDIIFLTGEHMKYTYERLLLENKKSVKYLPDRFALASELRKCLNGETVIFFKASRKIELEKIIHELK